MSKRKIYCEAYPDYGSRLNWLWHLMLFAILPRTILAPLRAEIHLTLVRLRSLFKGKPKIVHGTDLLVNIGAGPMGRAGWVNIDGWQQPGINLVYDCRWSLPFPDHSVRVIFTEHFLEHIDYVEDTPFFLAECHRVLRPGGIIRIIVPDVEQYLRAYCHPGWDRLRELTDGPSSTKMEAINEVFRGAGWHHKFAYDYETLELVLKKAGFHNIDRVSFGKSSMSELTIDSPGRARESLYVEAIK